MGKHNPVYMTVNGYITNKLSLHYLTKVNEDGKNSPEGLYMYF
jgi:hypothetical protein